MEGIVAHAVQTYANIKSLERRLERRQRTLEKTIDALTKEQFQEYAKLTTAMDQKENEKD